LATLRNLVVLNFSTENRVEARKYAKELFFITPRAAESFEIQRIAYSLDDEVNDESRIVLLFELLEKSPDDIWTLDNLLKLLTRLRDRDRLNEVHKRQVAARTELGIVDEKVVILDAKTASELDVSNVIASSGLTDLLPLESVLQDFEPDSQFLSWVAACLAGRSATAPITIESGAAVGRSGASSYTSKKYGPVIVISPTIATQSDESYIHDAFWFAIVFEILNRQAAGKFSSLNALAKRGGCSERDYISGVVENEYNNLLLASHIYCRLVRPSIKRAKKSDPLCWQLNTPSRFDVYFNSFKPTDEYPFRYYGTKYRLLRHPGFWPEAERRIQLKARDSGDPDIQKP
jgi:hypothetical protein